MGQGGGFVDRRARARADRRARLRSLTFRFTNGNGFRLVRMTKSIPLAALAAASFTACTSSTKPPAAPDCTRGTTETVAFGVKEVDATGALAALSAPVEVEFSGCAAVASDASGNGATAVGTDVPRSVRITGDNQLTTIFAERAITPATASESFFVFPTAFAATPGYSSSSATIVVRVAPTALGFGACGGRDGVAIALRDHPELTPTYLSAATTPASGATATTAFGTVLFTGATPGDRYEIVATKPGCEATTLDGAGIGLVPTEAGAVSVVFATVAPAACGAGPYITMTGTIQQRSVVDFSTSPSSGVDVSWSACPGVTTTTDSLGTWAERIPANTAFDLSFDKTGVIPYRFQELVLAGDSGGTLVMRGDEWKPHEPGWSDTGMTIFALVGLNTGITGSCATADGVTFAVHGHPEATVHYLDPSVPPQEAVGATATTTRGYAEITGLPAGRYQLDATTTKPCKLDPLAGNTTGFIDAVVGSENVIIISLENP
jgi:hypothetical protein